MTAHESMLDRSDQIARHDALLDISDVICTYRDLPALLHHLAARLRKVVEFDYVVLMLHDPAIDKLRIHILEILLPNPPSGPMTTGIDKGAAGWVFRNQEYLVFDSVDDETRFPDSMARLKSLGVRSCCYLPLTTPQQRLGTITFGSATGKRQFPETTMPFLQRVANQVAIAAAGR
jgi:formate hydrogenlyase transcriptional activator